MSVPDFRSLAKTRVMGQVPGFSCHRPQLFLGAERRDARGAAGPGDAAFAEPGTEHVRPVRPSPRHRCERALATAPTHGLIESRAGRLVSTSLGPFVQGTKNPRRAGTRVPDSFMDTLRPKPSSKKRKSTSAEARGRFRDRATGDTPTNWAGEARRCMFLRVWRRVSAALQKPLLFTEHGCSATLFDNRHRRHVVASALYGYFGRRRFVKWTRAARLRLPPRSRDRVMRGCSNTAIGVRRWMQGEPS